MVTLNGSSEDEDLIRRTKLQAIICILSKHSIMECFFFENRLSIIESI